MTRDFYDRITTTFRHGRRSGTTFVTFHLPPVTSELAQALRESGATIVCDREDDFQVETPFIDSVRVLEALQESLAV